MAIYRMLRMQCGRAAHKLHTLLYTLPTLQAARVLPLQRTPRQHTQAAQVRVRASDALDTGKVIRLLTIVDECRRESLAIEVDTSLGEFRVRRVLDRIALERGLLEAIVLDKGPFFGRNHLQFASRLRPRAHRPRCAFTTPTRREQASPS